MRIERLIEEGFRLGGLGNEDMDGIAIRDGQSLGQVMRSSAEPSTEVEDKRSRLERGDRRASVIQELKRQGSVFYDDSEIDGDDIGESETADTLKNKQWKGDQLSN